MCRHLRYTYLANFNLEYLAFGHAVMAQVVDGIDEILDISPKTISVECCSCVSVYVVCVGVGGAGVIGLHLKTISDMT